MEIIKEDVIEDYRKEEDLMFLDISLANLKRCRSDWGEFDG